MFFRNLGTKTKNFLGSMQGRVNKGMAFLNGTLLPGARKGIKFIKEANASLQDSEHVGVKVKKGLNNIEAIANAGFKNLSAGTDVANRLHMTTV